MFGGNIVAMIAVIGLVLWPFAVPQEKRASVWASEAFWFFVVTGGFFGLFIIGDTTTDPGGLTAVWLIALWFVPAALLCWQAVVAPAASVITLASLGVVVASFNIWTSFAGQWWRDFENGRGPIASIATFAVAIPMAVLGRKRNTAAGWLLLGTSLIPLLLVMARQPAARSLEVASLPAFASAVLYLLAGYYTSTHPRLSPSIYPATPPHA